ncbi:MAG: flavodoxin family protein, partial [Candidatus Bathyarchaeota archaeon]
MILLGIQSSPNVNGLTAQLAQAVLAGAESESAKITEIHLNQMKIYACKACNLDKRGWGTCRSDGKCSLKDDFQDLREKIHQADAVVFATPVYFGDLSESMKCFLDRWRRCEREAPNQDRLKHKPVVGIAAAGGRGGGAINALRNLETYLRWFGFAIFDLVPVTKYSKTHKIDMLNAIGKKLATRNLG